MNGSKEEGRRKEEGYRGAVLLVHRVALHARDANRLPSPSGALESCAHHRHPLSTPGFFQSHLRAMPTFPDKISQHWG